MAHRPGQVLVLAFVMCLGISACSGGGTKSISATTTVINNPPPPSGGAGSKQVVMPSGCGTDGALIIAEGAHSNGPPPAITSRMSTALATAIDGGAAIGVVSVEGMPVLTAADRFSSTAKNKQAKNQDRARFSAGIMLAIDRLRATSPHVDDLAALQLGADAIHAACAHGGTIFLSDPGLQDTGSLNFSSTDLLGADANDIVAFLLAQHELPDLTGIRVVLTGIGDTESPQQPLDQASLLNLKDTWTALVQAAHGVPVPPDTTPREGKPADNLPLVLTVPVPAPVSLPPKPKQPKQPIVIRLPDAGALGFLPDQAIFRDQTLAEAELATLAAQLISVGAVRITLTGTTSSEGGPSAAAEAGRKDLSLRRAAAVRDLLVRFGVASNRMTVEGVGIHFTGFQHDTDATGLLEPGPAAHNRSVIVTVTAG